MDIVHSLSIEKTVLSSIIFRYEEIYTVSKILEVEDFYSKVHQDIYKIMIELHSEDMPIDEEFIRKRGVGYSFTDTDLIDLLSVNPITNVEAYCFEIKEDSKIRKIQNLSKRIPRYIEQNSKSDDVLYTLQQEIENIENHNTNDSLTSKDLISVVLKDMELAAENGSKVLGQSSGLKALDKVIGAFEDGDLIVIAARPSMGKSSIISTCQVQSKNAPICSAKVHHFVTLFNRNI
ncbi:DnaB-like helicase N-terminal domain-containing protein [Poseidonibacter ostreae]|uniref:DNA 5'-3' helicase n=1 Tax=Poseidonibacter ostreae TaxID=2654171 RepID=A0A6L4WR87_9BACT|nr:DnaB-like helicase N-terminal domain-containing protein [Poseidonibacter ostreae]KAB7882964.1 hypothetical protein GA417_13600 [Poseidonibacter ostreae]KAB7884642.1 hypothetical protein GBG19_15485 [Poseidonibacter ostreae]KAB7887010.1 hypothetical protein GBG18_14315 [Poseidonibacter ostreae]